MNIKSFFFACLLAFTIFWTGFTTPCSAKSKTAFIHNAENEDYIYVRVDVDGVPWIFVYDKNGNLITSYPED